MWFCSYPDPEVPSKMEAVSLDTVKDLLVAGRTYQEMSEELKQLYPGIPHGLSARSVRRFVKDNELKQYVADVVQDVVEEAVGEVNNGAYFTSCCASLEFQTHHTKIGRVWYHRYAKLVSVGKNHKAIN